MPNELLLRRVRPRRRATDAAADKAADGRMRSGPGGPRGWPEGISELFWRTLSTEMWRMANRLRWFDEDEDEPDAPPEVDPEAASCEEEEEEEDEGEEAPVRRLPGAPRFGGRSRESVT